MEHAHFNFANKATARFDEVAAVHSTENMVFIELRGEGDEIRGRRYIKVNMRSRQEAEELVAEWIKESEAWVES